MQGRTCRSCERSTASIDPGKVQGSRVIFRLPFFFANDAAASFGMDFFSWLFLFLQKLKEKMHRIIGNLLTPLLG